MTTINFVIVKEGSCRRPVPLKGSHFNLSVFDGLAASIPASVGVSKGKLLSAYLTCLVGPYLRLQ